MAPDILYSACQRHQLCLALLPFTHARSESIIAGSLNSNFLQLGRRSGGRPQRTVYPRRLPVNTVIHTTLVGLEPATFRLCLTSLMLEDTLLQATKVTRFIPQVRSTRCLPSDSTLDTFRLSLNRQLIEVLPSSLD